MHCRTRPGEMNLPLLAARLAPLFELEITVVVATDVVVEHAHAPGVVLVLE